MRAQREQDVIWHDVIAAQSLRYWLRSLSIWARPWAQRFRWWSCVRCFVGWSFGNWSLLWHAFRRFWALFRCFGGMFASKADLGYLSSAWFHLRWVLFSSYRRCKANSVYLLEHILAFRELMVWFSNLQVGTFYLPALHNSAAGEKQDQRTSFTAHVRLVQYRRDWWYTNRNPFEAIKYPYRSHEGPLLWLGCPVLVSRRRQLAASTWWGRRWSPAFELRSTSSRSNLDMTFVNVLPNRWRFRAP